MARLRGWLVTEDHEDVQPRRVRSRERREQAAARAVVHLERYFDHPDPDELRKALHDLEEAVRSTG